MLGGLALDEDRIGPKTGVAMKISLDAVDIGDRPSVG
jgi:hypothetical protein